MFKSPLAQFDVICILHYNLNSIEFTITNLSLTALLGIIIGYIIIYYYFNSHLIPRNIQMILESIFLFVYRLVKQQAGNEGLIYFPLILALFTYILILNLLSLFPFAFAVTSHLI